eukprot:496160_1
MMRLTSTPKHVCTPSNISNRYFKTITSENDLIDDETLFEELSANLALSNINLSKQNITKVTTSLHSYPMIGPIQSPRGYKWVCVWSCDNRKCVKSRHRHKKNYRSTYFVSLKFGHSFVLCEDCVGCKDGIDKEGNTKPKEDQKEIEGSTESIANNQDKSIGNYISSLNLENMELKRNECFPILKSIPRVGLIKYCDHFGIRY